MIIIKYGNSQYKDVKLQRHIYNAGIVTISTTSLKYNWTMLSKLQMCKSYKSHFWEFVFWFYSHIYLGLNTNCSF